MEDGLFKWYKDKCNSLVKEELRKFTVAYGSLDACYHGYLSFLPQKVKINFNNFSDEDLKRLKKEFKGRLISQWKNKDKDSGVFFTVNIPYLGIDGCLAMFNDDNMKSPYPVGDCPGKAYIKVDTAEVKGKLVMVAQVFSMSKGLRTGYCEVELEKGSKDKFINLEIPASTAIRKALVLFGYGRFPTENTGFGSDPTILDFLAFKKQQKEKNKKGTT